MKKTNSKDVVSVKKVLDYLVNNNLVTTKDIEKLDVSDLLEVPDFSREELLLIKKFQDAIKEKTGVEYILLKYKELFCPDVVQNVPVQNVPVRNIPDPF